MGSQRYYAVKVGRRRGVYWSLEECQEQVLGYSNASYRRFSDKQLAYYWVFGKVDYIYTDGASRGNHDPDTAIAGYGVYFGTHDYRNMAEPLPGDRQTNQRAELYAIYAALKHIVDNDDFERKFLLYTDSQYAINCITVWYDKWEENDWTNSRGYPVANEGLIKAIARKLEFINDVYGVLGWSTLKIIKVSAHSGVYGNEMADKLANIGCDKNERNYYY